jgi:putative transcriptional regulator
MEFLETSVFTKQIAHILQDFEYADLQVHLTRVPDSGTLIPDGGGLRKIRWKAKERGCIMKKTLFNELIKSIKEARQIADGTKKPSRHFKVTPIDIKGLRESLKFSQPEFAHIIGISVATLRNWEQGRTIPDGPARVLMTAIKNNPREVIKAINT